jgi:hypothetical protein
MPGAGAADLADSAPTAKTLIERDVFGDPHCGQAMRSAEVIDLTNFSNRDLHDAQVYS